MYDELDMLEIRLNILDPYVDHFVIVEADEGYTGHKKEFFYEKNKERFAKWQHKIIYNKIENIFSDKDLLKAAYDSQNTGAKEHWWIREFYIKESLHFLNNLKDEDDIIFLSDMDEIWNPEIVINYAKNLKTDDVYRTIQTTYNFYLNTRSEQQNDHTATRFGKIKTLKKYGGNHFRTETIVKSIPIENAGWHFACLWKTSEKWNSGHPDDPRRIMAAISRALRIDEISLPKYLIDNREKYKHFFYENKL